MRRIVSAVLFAAVFTGTCAGQASANPSCGDTVTDVVLTADFDCSASPAVWALIVQDGGSVDLAGFTLTGTPFYGTHEVSFNEHAYGGGINCLGSCTINGGGGAIVPPAGLPSRTYFSTGVYSEPEVRKNLVTITDTEISGWSGNAVVSRGSASLTGCTINDNYFGAIAFWKMTMDQCTGNNNVFDAAHMEIGVITNSTFDGNGYYGVYSLRRLDLINSTITNTGEIGAHVWKLRAENSSIGESCLAPRDLPNLFCADVEAVRRPRLLNTPCDTSLKWNKPGYAWNVCALD